MKRAKRLIIAFGILLSLMELSVFGQIPNTMFFMPGVPQSNRINPAIQPGCGFYLGFPLISPLRFQVSSSSLAFNDIIFYNSDIDSLITPLHPLADKDAFLQNLQDVNYMLSSLGTSIGSIGFRVGKSFISLDITTRMDGNIYYPKGIFDVLFNGAPDGGTISLSGIGADINVFNEFSMGWSRKDFLIPGLDFGLRGKVMFGLANVNTQNSVLDIATSMDIWNIKSNMKINAAGAAQIISFSENFQNEIPFQVNENFLNTASPLEIAAAAFSLDQFGLAMDAGASFRPFSSLLISASVMDIGGINWKNSIQSAFDFEYDFMGINVNPFTGIDTTFISEFTDSVFNSISFVSGQPYYSKLNPKLFVGVSFYPIEKIGFGLLSRTDFLNEKISQQFTGTVNMTTGKFINLSLSYSYMSRTFSNIGAGLSFNLGPFNMYLISDNIVSGALNPLGTRSINLWYGMNLTFGWKRAEKKAKTFDMPLIH